MTAAHSPTVTVTKEQRRRFDEEGFLITDVVFDEATLEGVRGEFQRMWTEEIETTKKDGDKLAIDWATYRPHMARLDHRSEACREFCHHPVFADLCRQMLGADADLTWNQAIVKAPMPKQRDASTWDNVFAWHQDIWYALHGDYAKTANVEMLRARGNAFTCWCAISRTTVDNGTLWVIPGGHKAGLIHHHLHEARREWQAQLDPSSKIPVVLRPGQVLVFEKYLPHSSGTNVSDETRMAYQLSYAIPGMNLLPTPDVSPVLRAGKRV